MGSSTDDSHESAGWFNPLFGTMGTRLLSCHRKNGASSAPPVLSSLENVARTPFWTPRSMTPGLCLHHRGNSGLRGGWKLGEHLGTLNMNYMIHLKTKKTLIMFTHVCYVCVYIVFFQESIYLRGLLRNIVDFSTTSHVFQFGSERFIGQHLGFSLVLPKKIELSGHQWDHCLIRTTFHPKQRNVTWLMTKDCMTWSSSLARRGPIFDVIWGMDGWFIIGTRRLSFPCWDPSSCVVSISQWQAEVRIKKWISLAAGMQLVPLKQREKHLWIWLRP